MRAVNSLSHHLSHLLLENDCVILPGVGGFMAHDVPAYYIKEEHLYFPPARTVVFNAALTANDGLLAQQLMQSHKIGYVEACHLLEHYTDEIDDALMLDGSMELKGIGTLRQDIDGARSFVPCEEGIDSPAHFGLPSVAISSLADLRAEEPEPAQPLIGASVTEKAIHIHVGRRVVRAVAAAAAVIVLIFLAVKPLTQRLDEGLASLVPSFMKENLATRESTEMTHATVADTVPIILGEDSADDEFATAGTDKAALAIDEVVEFSVNGTAETVSATDNSVVACGENDAKASEDASDLLSLGTTMAEVTKPSDMSVAASPVTPPTETVTKRYHVIVASIAGRNGADEVRDRYAAKGYDNVTLLECDGRTRVSLASFASKDEANAFIDALRKQGEFKNAWLLPVKQ